MLINCKKSVTNFFVTNVIRPIEHNRYNSADFESDFSSPQQPRQLFSAALSVVR